MAILKLAPLLLLAACYSPDPSDCIVACSRSDDCAPNQLCNASGLCAGPDVHCAMQSDAGDDPMKPPPDAPPDAPVPLVKITVKIDGRGSVLVVGTGTCDGASGMAECDFDVPKNVPLTLEATPKSMWHFDKWTDACDHQPSMTCALTPDRATKAGVRFAQGGDVL
jgi:hypothetical protein